MAYRHTGKVLVNGAIDMDQVIENDDELRVQAKDDGRQIKDYKKGDFEWWYFDVYDEKTGCFLKIVLHIGTDPLRTRVFPQLAISVNMPQESNRGARPGISVSYPFSFDQIESDIGQCNISVENTIKIVADPGYHPQYFIKVDIPEFRCGLKFESEIEGWKPLGEKIECQTGMKKGNFSWVIPVPRARVDGYFNYDNKQYELTGAIGYHDHNYIRVDRKNPLYLDNLVKKWYWGKCYAGNYTVIFMDTMFRTNSILSLMVAEKGKIIYSSNNLIDCMVSSYGYDAILKTPYPESLFIKSVDSRFPFSAELEFDKILDSKDLLEGVGPVLKFLIKKLVAKPVYHGILARCRVEIENTTLEGTGNFESMIFSG
ncbi:MAG: hypothetical protein JW965_09845 [Bacteroidales bacterium]|nr:hypothetical protein [Bacteroidales bacterium]